MKLLTALSPLLLYCFSSSAAAHVVGADVLAAGSHDVRAVHRDHAHAHAHVRRQDGDGDSDDITKPPRLAKASQADINKARALVKSAKEKVAAHNKARLDHPLRNNYELMPGTKAAKRRRQVDPQEGPALFNVTDDIAAAAALVAEADAYQEIITLNNGTLRRRGARFEKRNRASQFWLGNTSHKGNWPFGNNANDFVVFRDVTDPKYGAKGDGVTDDTAAIRRAVEAGNMCGPGCYSSTTKGAIIYFPPGEYLVSGTIETYYGTQFIGDAVERPVIKAASSFVGLGVISTDKYVEEGGTGSDGNAKQWFINTANFYRQIRNFVIDITATDPGAYVCALHYQVAQATSLQFVEFRANTGTTQQGIFAENGSGGFMSDLVFNGGNFGIYGGNQQFTAQRLQFNGLTTAVQLIWDWGWAWKSVYIKNCEVGFKLLSEDNVKNTGSILVVDSVFEGVGKAILTFPATTEKGDGTTGLTLDNVKFIDTDQGVVDTAGKSYLGTGSDIDTFVLGRIYVDQEKSTSLHTTYKTPRDPTLTGSNPWNLPKAPFYEKGKPQYGDKSASDIRHVKDSCSGNGQTDDTSCIQNFLNNNVGRVVYFDAGSYIITDTVTVPSGSILVGENWSQLVAFGTKFADATKPRPLIKVGEKGQRGEVEMQDLIFTSKGPTAGVVFVEWNIRASGAGRAGMWDCHVRVGGASGTDLTVAECPAGSINDKCKAGSALMHITPEASGYFENVWLWVADHDIDDPNWSDDNNFMEQCSIFVARGLLVESTTATWLYGTSSEHALFYQYEFFNAKKVAASMIQTESPYFQPVPNPPAPMENAVGHMPGDPTYRCSAGETCDSSWALRILNSSQIQIHGAGLYSWFDDYTQDCLQTVDCQKSLIDIKGNFGNVIIHNLITIGAVNMIEGDEGLIVKASDNQAVDFHPRWSQISVFDPRQYTNPCTSEPIQTNPDIRPGVDKAVFGDGDNTNIGYLTIVNGCPNEMTFLGEHQHQMRDWEEQWISIPAGESAQFKIEFFDDFNMEDSAGEAYYQLKGTDKKWHVQADDFPAYSENMGAKIFYTDLQTNDAARGTQHDLRFPSRVSGLTMQWVLTGSEKYGYWSSHDPPANWMHAILDIIGERKLKYVCMPGSHDAGMSKIDGKTAFATWENSQTQWLDFYGQLVRGSRWFDVRPCLGNGGKHMLCHYTVTCCSAVGANGDTVDNMISQINRFMDDHPGELVILDVNNESGFDTDHRTSRETYERLTDAQWEPIWTKIRDGITKPCKGFGDRNFAEVTMNEFIGDGRGCVLTLARGLGAAQRDETKGFYLAGQLQRDNDYSDTVDYNHMRNDQIAKMKLKRRLGPEGAEGTDDGFFILSWTMTLGAADAITPLNEHASIAQPTLFWYAYHEFTPFSYPNVLYVDYLGQPKLIHDNGLSQEEYMEQTTSQLAALAMAVNLQIASQNCYVGGGKI